MKLSFRVIDAFVTSWMREKCRSRQLDIALHIMLLWQWRSQRSRDTIASIPKSSEISICKLTEEKSLFGILSQALCRELQRPPFKIKNGYIMSQARKIALLFFGEGTIPFSLWRFHRRVEERLLLPRATTTLKICPPWQERKWLYSRKVRAIMTLTTKEAKMNVLD